MDATDPSLRRLDEGIALPWRSGSSYAFRRRATRRARPRAGARGPTGTLTRLSSGRQAPAANPGRSRAA
ncbi:MAG: hypothetical protein LC799_16685 [Actinobacteria bacterium]|nr:hypothetical protein [Actinomycetota bacterium]